MSLSQITFSFFAAHRAALDKAKEQRRRDKMLHAAQLRRERRGTLRHLLELSELPESHLSAQELRQLDDYVWNKCVPKIRSEWSELREAEARGVNIRNAARLFCFGGNIYQSQIVDRVSDYGIEAGEESWD